MNGENEQDVRERDPPSLLINWNDVAVEGVGGELNKHDVKISDVDDVDDEIRIVCDVLKLFGYSNLMNSKVSVDVVKIQISELGLLRVEIDEENLIPT
jgi:hypothetical protein